MNRTKAIAWLGGAANNNEDCYLGAKLMRALGYGVPGASGPGLTLRHGGRSGPTFGRGAMTNHWDDLKNADVILVIGANPAENHPASMLWVNRAREERGALLVVDPRFTRTASRRTSTRPSAAAPTSPSSAASSTSRHRRTPLQQEYVSPYTNALNLIDPDYKGPADLDG